MRDRAVRVQFSIASCHFVYEAEVEIYAMYGSIGHVSYLCDIYGCSLLTISGEKHHKQDPLHYWQSIIIYLIIFNFIHLVII